jgi:hypothetical protein
MGNEPLAHARETEIREHLRTASKKIRETPAAWYHESRLIVYRDDVCALLGEVERLRQELEMLKASRRLP